MSIDTRKPLTQEEADLKHMVAHAFRGVPLDPEIARRVHERAEQVQAKMRERGIKIDAMELIRQSREEI